MIQVWDLLSCPPGAFAVGVSPLIEEQLSNLCLSERQRMVMSSCVAIANRNICFMQITGLMKVGGFHGMPNSRRKRV